jgi:hypothetical protein
VPSDPRTADSWAHRETMARVEGSVGITCTRCETLIVVMPAEAYEAAGPETELEFTAHFASGETQTGNRLAVADANRHYACPACGERGRLPPPEAPSTG